MYINYNYNYMNKEHEILYFYRFLMRFPYRRSCYAFSLSLPPRSKAANFDFGLNPTISFGFAVYLLDFDAAAVFLEEISS